MKRFLTVLCVFALAVACGKDNPEGGSGGGSKPATITGTVTGNDGTLIVGAVVSDGLNCVKTDASGRFALPSDLTKTDYVFVSTPKGWAAPVERGQATFWKFLKDCTPGADGKYTIAFTLKKITNPERFTVFIFADPQPRKHTAGTDQYAYAALECCQDMYKDMKELKGKMTDRPVYAIGLGDIVHQDLSLIEDYKDGMATTGLSTYNVIGNHDQEHKMGVPDTQAHKNFEAQLGPVNYSFNLGNIHFLVVDNMIAQETGYSDECATGLRDDIWEWVKNDLALVPKTCPVMVCGHSPMFKMYSHNETTNAMVIKDRSGQHLGDLKNLLAKFSKSYAWAGHTHTTFNYVDKDNDNVVESHTLSRVTGALWSNEYQGSNGTPRGYVVLEYDNGDITWKFKPIYWQTAQYQEGKTKPAYTYRDWNYDAATGRAKMKVGGAELTDAYQMQVYGPKVYGETDSYVYANIFMWDEKWKNPVFTSGGIPTPMTRVVDVNKRYSFSNWELNKFYWEKRRLSVFEDEYNSSFNNCASLFSAYVNTPTGSGTVSVQDRFGNTYTSTITW